MAAVHCGACNRPIVDIEGKPKPAASIYHDCKRCKKPLHSYVTKHCTLWMPDDGAYFCSAGCLKAFNQASLQVVRQEAEDETFGPGSDGWDDWLEDNSDKYFMLRRRPDAYNALLLGSDYDEEEEDDDDDGGGEQAKKPLETGSTAEGVDLTAVSSPQGGGIPLASLLAAGNRLQECFLFDNGADVQEHAWYGGYVGHRGTDGNFAIGFDDGELRVACERELTALYSMNKLCQITVNGGLVHGKPSPLKAAELSYMTCGADRVPVGVFLVDHVGELAGCPIYHSHVVNVEAVAAATSSQHALGRLPTRSSKNKEGQSKGVDPRAGWHTFRRGDRLLYLDVTEADGIDVDLFDTCFGIIVVTYRRAQQLRFIISYDSGTERFSVAPWTAWRRVPQEEDTDLDVAQVFVASGEDISDMESAARSDQFCSDQFCSSSPNPELRYGMSPTSFRHEIRGLKRQHYVLSQEMHEIVDPICRQRQAREIALLEARLHERGVCL